MLPFSSFFTAMPAIPYTVGNRYGWYIWHLNNDSLETFCLLTFASVCITVGLLYTTIHFGYIRHECICAWWEFNNYWLGRRRRTERNGRRRNINVLQLFYVQHTLPDVGWQKHAHYFVLFSVKKWQQLSVCPSMIFMHRWAPISCQIAFFAWELVLMGNMKAVFLPIFSKYLFLPFVLFHVAIIQSTVRMYVCTTVYRTQRIKWIPSKIYYQESSDVTHPPFFASNPSSMESLYQTYTFLVKKVSY